VLYVAGRFDELWAKTQKEIPGARIVMHKDSTLRKVIFGLLKALVWVFTFGKGRTNWDTFTTTISRTLYVPDTFWWWSDEDRYRLLRHELVHLRQVRSWPFPFLNHWGVWRINSLIFGICYLLVLPVRWTLRAKFEREGYTQTMLVWWELHERWNNSEAVERYVAWMVKTFGTSVYFFMDSKKHAEKWARETIEKIKKGEITNDRDRIDLAA
jgi:hypothetical protein